MKKIHEENKSLTEVDILNLVSELPKVDAAIIYGSAFFKQTGVDTGEKKSYDVMLLVENPNQWHRENHKLHSEDYSFTGGVLLQHGELVNKFIPSEIHQKISCIFKENYKGNEIKFLIIQTRMALNSAYTWDYISIPGRWHKEIKVIENNIGQELEDAIEYNRASAAKVSLILDDREMISEDDFEESIANISYMKDVRMTTGSEDEDKVKNIRDGSKQFFRMNYVNLPFILSKGNYILNSSLSIKSEELPVMVQQYISEHFEISRGKAVKQYLEHRTEVDSVALASRCFLTTGPKKAAQVFVGKRIKGMKSRLHKNKEHKGIVFTLRNSFIKDKKSEASKQLVKK